MNQRNTIIERYEIARAKMLTNLKEIDRDRKIYPLWTIREVLAHISGWDDATIGFINSLINNFPPATPAVRGMDVYNAETVSTREGLSYDHIYREYIETRRKLIDLIRSMPEEKILQSHVLPWGGEGTLVDLANIFAPHEEDHAGDVKLIIQEIKSKAN